MAADHQKNAIRLSNHPQSQETRTITNLLAALAHCNGVTLFLAGFSFTRTKAWTIMHVAHNICKYHFWRSVASHVLQWVLTPVLYSHIWIFIIALNTWMHNKNSTYTILLGNVGISFYLNSVVGTSYTIT